MLRSPHAPASPQLRELPPPPLGGRASPATGSGWGGPAPLLPSVSPNGVGGEESSR